MTTTGNVLVEVWLYASYTSSEYEIPASPENPCKVSLPYDVAQRFVDSRLADYCDDPSTNDCPECPKGFPGVRGQNGDPGKDGARGQDGKDGTDGLDGKDGEDGAPGERGCDGPINFTKGPPGKKGCPGVKGPPGRDGLNGENGLPGMRGENGITGIPGIPGFPGLKGETGGPGPAGLPGIAGTDGKICADFPCPLVITENEDGSVRAVTYDENCNVVDDVLWECIPETKCWRREFETTFDFNATDYKVRDDAGGMGYEFPLGDGRTCSAEFLFSLPSSQPCRSAACGHTNNTYEDTYPNVNAYGISNTVNDPPCQDVPITLCFDKPICGDLAITFIDIDQESPPDVQPPCNEIISAISPAPSGVSGDLTEIGSTGTYTGIGTGNTNSDGDLLFTNLEATNCINFSVRLAGGLSLGLGLSGTQTFKFEETGTYIGDTFYDADGNAITEPVGWVDVACL